MEIVSSKPPKAAYIMTGEDQCWFFKENGKGLDTTIHPKMDMQDLYRDIVDYFISYGDETVNDSD